MAKSSYRKSGKAIWASIVGAVDDSVGAFFRGEVEAAGSLAGAAARVPGIGAADKAAGALFGAVGETADFLTGNFRTLAGTAYGSVRQPAVGVLGERLTSYAERAGRGAFRAGVAGARVGGGLAGMALANPGVAGLALGVGGVGFMAAPFFAGQVSANMDQARYAEMVQRSYSSPAETYQPLESFGVAPSPGTGAAPSLRDVFMNSTAGLVQGLHASRIS